MKRFTSIAALTAFLLTGVACGDDSTDSSNDTSAPTSEAVVDTTTGSPDTTAASPDTTEAGDEVPQAIVSLSPTATEMLFAIGAGDQVIAVDDYSNFPAEALEKPHDLSAYEPNIEAIAALNPDLVVLSGPDIAEQLEDLGIAVWVGNAAVTFEDVYDQIEQLGAMTGHIAEAAELVGQMQTDIAAAVAAVPVFDAPLTYYHELDNTFYSVTSDTFIGQIYGLFGLTNIADGVEEGNSYPQLSAEYIISSAPDFIFLADTKCCGESVETVGARAGWAAIPAVAGAGVVEMDDDIASRWGPRIVDYIEAVSAAVSKVTVGS